MAKTLRIARFLTPDLKEGDGEMGKWGNGEMGKWGNYELGNGGVGEWGDRRISTNTPKP
ncbi:hypothetical protein [Microcystis panniformis]|uniref:hypothetical protein n=1 Tax=Microcystis panniformis TaxID=513223 RepID=UPI001395FF50|nr:hypothetical protein [Microcystis panniformis]